MLFPNPYWEERKHYKYYSYMHDLIRKYAIDAKSVIDIGSAGIPFVEKLDWIPEKYSLDIIRPYQSETVTGIVANFYHFTPKRNYDVATCMQVLEHVENPDVFVHKLLKMAKHVFISVPYKEPMAYLHEGHINGMICEETLHHWTGRKPDFYFIVPYIDSTAPTYWLICYYKT
jgi:hypothetical protein